MGRRILGTLLEAILEVTVNNRSFSTEEVVERSGVSAELLHDFLRSLIDDGLIGGGYDSYYLRVPRYLLVQYLYERGFVFDPERIARYFTWDEFEDFVRFIFQSWGFRVIGKFRSIRLGLEIDLVVARKPHLILIEAKRWRRVRGTRLIVRKHLAKVKRLASDPQYLANKLDLDWNYAILIPLVVTWRDLNIRFEEGVPVVGIYRLNSLVSQFDLIIDSIVSFRIGWTRLT